MFLSGEFSKISQVTRRTLHYYDEIGLFKPLKTDSDSGYRYYSAHQLPELNRILVLKDLGFGLDEIQRMVKDNISDTEIEIMLKKRKSEVESQISESLSKLKNIEARINQNQGLGSSYDIVIKSVPESLFISDRVIFTSSEQAQETIAQMTQALSQSVDAQYLGALAAVFHSEDFSPTYSDTSCGFILKKPYKKKVKVSHDMTLRMTTLPSVDAMATVVQVGSPEQIFLAFGALGHWIEEHGYLMDGPYRELGFEWGETPNLESMAVEIQVPIRKV